MALPARGQNTMPNALPAMPEGYHLQAYDDCGAPGRQSHIVQTTSHTFSTAEVNADERVRSVAWGWKQVDAVYDNLDPRQSYVLAVTYANEAFNNRVQSLWAGDIEIHGPHPLPKGGYERLLFRVPGQAIKGGRLSLQFKLEARVNVVVSIVELWAPAPSPKTLRLCDVGGLISDLTGEALDLGCDPVPGATVELRRKGETGILAAVKTGTDGRFRFDRRFLDGLKPRGDLEILAARGGSTAAMAVPKEDLYFEPVRYRPIPTHVNGRSVDQISLDGAWRIRTDDPGRARALALDAPGWGAFHVPGQWLQQGCDVPQDTPVTVAREFTVPKAWARYRTFLRFDAIHAGVHYRLNGKYLGYTENLFTPVEWEITDAVRPGQTNRLDLEMVVDTPSERLSYSSGYAFHNLGGIDRAVHVYILPRVDVRSLRISTDLDREYRDADLNLQLTLDNPGRRSEKSLAVRILLYGPNGKPVAHSRAFVALDTVPAGLCPVAITCHVPDPVKWNAEKPRLHRLVLELEQSGVVVERIERNIGFRKIEIRGAQLLINGRPVKLAGACHHETDPLTGRADTMRHAEQDVRLLKAANLNYIRTSHYPPCQELLDAADRLGMYVEVEAPFCWVGEEQDMSLLKQVLTPTSAMVDYCSAHPSVIVWSLANESAFNRLFEASNHLCKTLDPTRPTTFNNPDPKRICDIANLHYPPVPFDDQLKGDPRPIFLGEYDFPVCHEQTDVRIDPGLRELWGAGQSDPNSAWGRACAASYERPGTLLPGEPPGAWTSIVRSRRVIGGAIWAALDEPFYFSNGKKAGYAWVHGFWGIIDAWRRPKPEWWLCKLIFSPVWFPVRKVDFSPGQAAVRIPVENRYSFTNLNELKFTWEVDGKRGSVRAKAPPDSRGEIALPIPPGTHPGDTLLLHVTNASGDPITVLSLQLGQRPTEPLPQPRAGVPRWNDDGKTITIEDTGFHLVLDRSTARFRPLAANNGGTVGSIAANNGGIGSPTTTDPGKSNPRSQAVVLEFPTVHVTQYDFGDLGGPYARPYAVLPDPRTRVIESITAKEKPEGLEVAVTDRYEGFAGTVRWIIDRMGMGRVTYDYVYSGPDMSAREIGIRFLLKPACDEVRWERWSEWGNAFPKDDISRTEGSARAFRAGRQGSDPEGVRPTWPWSQDQTELGTSDFRSIKFNIYQASLLAPDGSGLRVYANADAHVRLCLDPKGVMLHLLSECRMGPVILHTGDRIRGENVVELLPRR